MSDESFLRDKLRKIEALFAGAATAGEKAAAGAAAADAIRTNAMAGAKAFTDIAQAEVARQQTELSWSSRAALFTNQIIAFNAAPSVYRQRAYYQMFADATANARKYILLATNTQDVVVLNLEDKIRDDLLNLNVPSTNSP